MVGGRGRRLRHACNRSAMGRGGGRPVHTSVHPETPLADPCASLLAPTYLPSQRRQVAGVKAACGRPPKGVDARRCGASLAGKWGGRGNSIRFFGVDPKIELLGKLSEALTRGQGEFTEEDLALAYEEVFKMLLQAQLGELVIEGKLNLRITDGTVLYTIAMDGQGSEEAVPLEVLIENVRSAEGE